MTPMNLLIIHTQIFNHLQISRIKPIIQIPNLKILRLKILNKAMVRLKMIIDHITKTN
jgi:hypothetical protein